MRQTLNQRDKWNLACLIHCSSSARGSFFMVGSCCSTGQERCRGDIKTVQLPFSSNSCYIKTISITYEEVGSIEGKCTECWNSRPWR